MEAEEGARAEEREVAVVVVAEGEGVGGVPRAGGGAGVVVRGRKQFLVTNEEPIMERRGDRKHRKHRKCQTKSKTSRKIGGPWKI